MTTNERSDQPATPSREDFEARLRRYYRESVPRCPKDYRGVRAQTFAPVVVCVEDSDGEYPIFFDTRRWKYVTPGLWQSPDGDYPGKELRALELGILEGVGLTFRGKFDRALAYAKHALTSDTETWLASPEPFEL